MTYSIFRNYCQCHPETCCCLKWFVGDSSGKIIARYENKQEAEQLIIILKGKK